MSDDLPLNLWLKTITIPDLKKVQSCTFRSGTCQFKVQNDATGRAYDAMVGIDEVKVISRNLEGGGSQFKLGGPIVKIDGKLYEGLPLDFESNFTDEYPERSNFRFVKPRKKRPKAS